MSNADITEFMEPAVATKAVLGKIADLLDRNGISVDDVGRVENINLWQGFYKDEDGEAHTVDMAGIKLSPKWETGPEWPVVQQCKPFVVKAPKSTAEKRDADGFKTAVVLPDMQIGYYLANGILVPTHDERAIDVALMIVAAIKPDRVICVGDNMDFPELSKYRLARAFERTTQATIERTGLLNAQLRQAAGPSAEIDWIEGNHEARISNYILDNAKAAFGLKRSNDAKGWPVLSVPFLTRMDEHNIRYRPGYPATEVWINERVRVIHGTHVVSNGSTAQRYLSNDRVSTIYGHIHRREWAERTRSSYSGSQTVMAMSPGCLARVDGKVPSTKGGNDLDGTPIPVAEDWQQGIAVVRYEDGNGRFLVEQVPIWDGWTIYHGKHYKASQEAIEAHGE